MDYKTPMSMWRWNLEQSKELEDKSFESRVLSLECSIWNIVFGSCSNCSADEVLNLFALKMSRPRNMRHAGRQVCRHKSGKKLLRNSHRLDCYASDFVKGFDGLIARNDNRLDSSDNLPPC